MKNWNDVSRESFIFKRQFIILSLTIFLIIGSAVSLVIVDASQLNLKQEAMTPMSEVLSKSLDRLIVILGWIALAALLSVYIFGGELDFNID